MTRGRCGSLLLHRVKLSFTVPSRLSGANGGSIMGRTRADVRAGSLALAPALAFALILFQGFTTPAGAQPPLYVTQWDEYASGYGQFADPNRVATDAAHHVFVADHPNSRILRFTETGTFLGQFGGYGTGNGQLAYVNGLATDAEGNVYVAD